MKFKQTILYFLAILCSSIVVQAQTAEQKEASLRRDIGEMLLVGFRGQDAKSCGHIERDIKEYHIGGVILFEYDVASRTRNRNVASPSQLKRLCNQLQQMAGGSLIISIDQEGGKVCRMRAKDGFHRTPSPMYCAQSGYDTVRHYARLTAQMLRQAGVNMDFAPVADVNVNPSCPVIGAMERSFSADTAVVAQCCDIWLQELGGMKVAGCMKHFPGHGSASGDTHQGLVDVSGSWQEYELAPYRSLIASGSVPMVMVAHVVNSKIDSKWPASLSYKTVTGLLRNRLGFDGVVVTDDLEMGAIIKQYDYETVIYQAIMAGNDMLCLSNNGSGRYNADIVPQTVDIIMRLVKAGRLTAEQIHASAERIRRLKKSIM